MFSPDGALVLSSSADNTARLWRMRTGECIGVFSGHTHYVRSAVFSPDAGHTLAHYGAAATC